MEGGSFEDDFVDPHRFRYAEYKQKARFRASKQGQSIYNEDQDDQRYNNNYTDFHNRRSRSMPNRNTYQEGMEFSFGRFREQERENRYFPDYKERKDRYLQNKNERFFPQSREFTNTQYKQRQQTNRRALTDRGLFPDHRLVRTFPRDTYNTDQFYNDFDQERTQKRMARTTRRNHRKTLGRRTRNEGDENWYYDDDNERDYNPRDYDAREYQTFVQESDTFHETEPPRPHAWSKRDAYIESSRGSASGGAGGFSCANGASRDIRKEQPPNRFQGDRETRRFPQKEGRGKGRPRRYFDQTNQKSNYIPATTKLRTTVKVMYKLIRFVHHLNKTTTKVTNNTPVTFKRLTDLLINSIKPAMPDDSVKKLLEGNARNWAHNAQSILEEHYEILVEKTITELRQQTDPADWFQAFEIAKTWTNKNFGRRVDTDIFTRVEALFTAESCDEYDRRERQKASRAATVDEAPRETQTVRPKVGTTHIYVQTSPRAPNGTTNTPPIRGDWSFDMEFPPLEPRPALEPTPVRSVPPLPKRKPRRIFTDLLVNTEEQTDRVEKQTTNMVETQQRKQNPLSPSHESLQVQERADVTTTRTENNIIVGATTLAEIAGPQPLPSLIRLPGSPVLFSEDSEELQPYSGNTARQLEFLEEMVRENETERQKEATQSETVESVTGSRQKETQQEEAVAPATPTTPRTVGRPYRHINTDRKQTDWSLNLKKKFIILGDSNVSRIPAFHIPDLQIDSFPGAKFQHAGNLVEKATIALEPEILVMSFGLNNRSQRCFSATSKEIHRAYRLARTRLPHTEIVVPVVNFCDQLPRDEQNLLLEINEYIRTNLNFLDPLPSAQFRVESDSVHWTSSTARYMLEHWARSLNF